MGHKSYEQIAKSMFEAFLKERKRLGSASTDYIKWESLTRDQQSAWVAAAKQAAAELALIH